MTPAEMQAAINELALISMQEIHPDGDELILVLAGAIDLIAESDGGEVVIGLDAGQAAVVTPWYLASARHACTGPVVDQRTIGHAEQAP